MKDNNIIQKYIFNNIVIKMNIKKMLILVIDEIRSGFSVKDSIIIAISWLIYFCYIFIPRYLCLSKRKLSAFNGEFIFWDITVKNRDGIFYCRKRSNDLPIISPIFEKEISKYFKLDKGIFIDIGANIGKYTIMVGKRLDGKIISFEPDADNYKILLNNMALNKLGNVIPLDIGLWKEKCILKFYDSNNKNTGAKTIFHTPHLIGSIKVDRLDKILKDLEISTVDLIKIDAEGAEVQILEGAMDILKCKPKLIFESLNEENFLKIKEILQPYNYNIEKTILKDYYVAY